MFLKNWAKIHESAYKNSPITVTRTTGATLTGTGGYGDCYRFGFSWSVGPYMKAVLTNISKTVTTGGIIFGDGATPPTFEDYNLSGSLITTINPSVAFSQSEDATGVTFNAVCTLVNTGSSAITISEVGLCTTVQSGNHYPILVERTLLDNPITIQPAGVGQVTYTIRHTFLTA